ncbi:hypothetical protein A0J61_01362 [Choanephora cucurbitarum]|uniref:Uncharacterized protein n=1 Tax=Choanephora cucurbitarum TaxID=101091 RepID=A0A1C7NSV3_9FUNG|nr:hypothetical protein A0J61_01362 [Choanephora cucurbitarum]
MHQRRVNYAIVPNTSTVVSLETSKFKSRVVGANADLFIPRWFIKVTHKDSNKSERVLAA